LPFLFELAHYEWVELALDISEETINLCGVDPDGDLLQGVPMLSPLVWPLTYRYPVHRIRPDFQPQFEELTHLVVYRNRHDEVHFLETNAVTLRLLQLLDEETMRSGRLILEQVAQELNHLDPEVVIHSGLAILQDLRSRDIVLGVQAVNDKNDKKEDG
jgi:hypothetical protein